MPEVPFTLKDFGLETTRGRRANVIFTPSNAAAMGPDGMLVGRVVVKWSEINPETGVGVATLAETTFLRPATHYVVSIEWLDDAPSGWAEIKWPVQVPAAGGPLSELLKIPWPLGALAISPIPPNSTVDIGGLWVDNSKEPAKLMKKIGATSWVEMAVLGALGDPAAANLVLNDTLTRAAVVERVQQIVVQVVADDPNVAAAAVAAIQEALADEDIVTSASGPVPKDPDDEGMLADASGKPTDMGFGKDGRISNTTMKSAQSKGMVRAMVSDDGSEITFVDDGGRRFALGFDAHTGLFSERTLHALRSQLGVLLIGDRRPQALRGFDVFWEQTDAEGNTIERFRGDNR